MGSRNSHTLQHRVKHIKRVKTPAIKFQIIKQMSEGKKTRFPAAFNLKKKKKVLSKYLILL